MATSLPFSVMHFIRIDINLPSPTLALFACIEQCDTAASAMNIKIVRSRSHSLLAVTFPWAQVLPVSTNVTSFMNETCQPVDSAVSQAANFQQARSALSSWKEKHRRKLNFPIFVVCSSPRRVIIEESKQLSVTCEPSTRTVWKIEKKLLKVFRSQLFLQHRLANLRALVAARE